MKVNQAPSTRNEEEGGTEVLRNKEEEQTKPATIGTEIPYDASPSQSSANSTLPNVKTIPYQNQESVKKFILTSERRAKHLFAGRNTHQLCTFEWKVDNFFN